MTLKISRSFVAFTLFCFLSSSFVFGQDDEFELILEEDEGQVQVRTGKKPEELEENVLVPKPSQEVVDPSQVIVAIVNARVLTLEEINVRVSRRYDDLVQEVQAQYGGIVAEFESGQTEELAVPPLYSEFEDEMVLEEQKVQLERVIRRAEEEALYDWINHSMLADEARRQGIIISDSEFRARLREAETQNQLVETEVEKFLSAMKMQRADYERYVYDALLIEKLLNQYIDLNYDLDYFEAAYNNKPHLYYEPEKFKIAHFTISAVEDRADSEVRDLRRLAGEVREELKDGKEPEIIFSRPEYNDFQNGIYGNELGWFTFYEGHLPKLVEHRARDLELGETSDVLLQKKRLKSGDIVISSIHVVKIVEKREATGMTFESALPTMRRAMIEIAKANVTQLLREAGSHKVISNMRGIPPEKIPDPMEIRTFISNAEPINLKLPEKPVYRAIGN